jgi:hypothetical protein
MQDKDLHTNKNLTDRAWKEMRFLLDKEMPVEEKDKKRPILFWFSGASAIAALIAVIYFINLLEINNNKLMNENERTAFISESPNNESNPEQKDHNQSIIINKKEGNNFTLNAITNPSNKNNIKTKEDSISKSKKTQPIASNEPIKKWGINNNGTSVLYPISTTENTESKNVPLKNNDTEKINDKPENKIIVETEISPIHLNEINKIEHLTLQTINYSNKIHPVFLGEKNLKTNNKNTLFASNLFMVNSKSHGVSIGYLRDIKTINKNWNVNAGISYKYLAQPIEYTLTEVSSELTDTSGLGSPELKDDLLLDVGYANTTTSRLLDNNGDPTLYTNGSSDIPFNKLKLHYLTIPVNLQYQKNRMFFNAGVQVSLLLVAKNSSLTGGIAKEIGLTNDLSETNFFNANNAERTNPSIPDLSNFDFSTTLGIGYSLTKNMDIHFSYLHGLKDVIKNNLNKDNNRHFQLALQYSW